MRILTFLVLAALLLPLASCAESRNSPTSASDDSSLRAAHDAYVRSINANNVDTFLAMITDDAVFMPPNEPILAGKSAVRPWAAAYLDTFQTRWEKPVLEVVVRGEWAFEQYTFTCTNLPRKGGQTLTDAGKGLMIFHRDADGAWRVARDCWNSDRP